MAYTFKHGDRPLDDYTIQRAVGRGGFGEVYYAMSDGGREVAIKYLKENPQVELRGVGHCINLKSPHLVSIFDVKKNADGDYFIIMEYCSGPSLRDLLIAEPSGFGVEKAAFFARETAKGLAYLHERGIVHRDLKPGNIFYDDGYVKIGDYGLSKFISVSRHSAQTASVGTVHYMAPEIGSGNYSRGVDIYALGVILYEMLCGKVPFEGSSMAEVLMKHLTSQPELDNLPQPFGQVIRKALEKDPKDRYQTVEEMVEEMLAGEEIQKSLAGFSPRSLEGAVRQAGRDRADSPLPSPNPTPRSPQGYPPRPPARATDAGPLRGGALPDRVARKMERIQRKIERKMAKYGPRPGGVEDRRAAEHAPDRSPLAHVAPRKRIVLVGFLLIALALGLGLCVGNASWSNGEERGAAAGMLVVAMFFGVLLGRKGTAWFTVQDGPTWAQYMVRAVCAAPLLAIGCAPIFDTCGGLAVWLGLIATATFTNWEKLVDGRTDGEISFGPVFSKWIGALVLTSIAAGLTGYHRPDRVMFISAGVAAVVAFVMQAAAAWIPYRRRDLPAGAGDPAQAGRGPAPTQTCCPMAAGGPPPPPGTPWATPAAQPLVPDSGQASLPVARARWALTRAFWGLVAFGLMGGAIVTFLIPLIANDMDHHDVTLAVILCTGFASFMIFALCKTGPVKRVGFWRETLRPFLISASLFGIGGTITGIAREWYHSSTPCDMDLSFNTPEDADVGVEIGELVKVKARVHEAQKRIAAHVGPWRLGIEGRDGGIPRRCVGDEGRVALVSGLVFSSLLFLSLMLSFLTGGSPRSAQPFLQDGESGSLGVGSAAAPSGARPRRSGSGLVPLTVAAIIVLFLAMFLLLASR
ncbi:MAG: serine/threonine-protein kinase [Planctomycetota bacterium]